MLLIEKLFVCQTSDLILISIIIIVIAVTSIIGFIIVVVGGNRFVVAAAAVSHRIAITNVDISALLLKSFEFLVTIFEVFFVVIGNIFAAIIISFVQIII